MATRRQITLSESPNAPTLEALCDDLGWNGSHVPLLTAQELADHIAALAANDPNGTWSALVVSTLPGVFVKMWDRDEDPEAEDAYVWSVDSATGRAPIDGLTWFDPTTDEEV